MSNHQVDLLARYVTRVWQFEDGRLISDLPVSQVHWNQLQQRLKNAEQQAQEEWS